MKLRSDTVHIPIFLTHSKQNIAKPFADVLVWKTIRVLSYLSDKMLKLKNFMECKVMEKF